MDERAVLKKIDKHIYSLLDAEKKKAFDEYINLPDEEANKPEIQQKLFDELDISFPDNDQPLKIRMIPEAYAAMKSMRCINTCFVFMSSLRSLKKEYPDYRELIKRYINMIENDISDLRKF